MAVSSAAALLLAVHGLVAPATPALRLAPVQAANVQGYHAIFMMAGTPDRRPSKSAALGAAAKKRAADQAARERKAKVAAATKKRAADRAKAAQAASERKAKVEAVKAANARRQAAYRQRPASRQQPASSQSGGGPAKGDEDLLVLGGAGGACAPGCHGCKGFGGGGDHHSKCHARSRTHGWQHGAHSRRGGAFLLS